MSRQQHDELDAMLRSYCQRRGQVSFHFETEESSMNKRTKGFLIPTAAVCLAAAVGAGIFHWTSYHTGANPEGFIVKAYAAEASADEAQVTHTPTTISNIKTHVTSEAEQYSFPDISFSKTDSGVWAGSEGIWFTASGDDLKTLDISCENNSVYYFVSDLKDEQDENISVSFQQGKIIDAIPYDELKNKGLFISWIPTAVDEAFMQFIHDKGYTDEEYKALYEEDIEKMSALAQEFYNGYTVDDYVKAFSDVVTMTAHYKDGTSETAVIEIGVEVHEYTQEELKEVNGDGDTNYFAAGHYTIQYK